LKGVDALRGMETLSHLLRLLKNFLLLIITLKGIDALRGMETGILSAYFITFLKFSLKGIDALRGMETSFFSLICF